jgi:DNA-binding NarL/FixJ family response regulator
VDVVRIVLVGLAGIVLEIVRQVLDEQDDMIVVAELPDHTRLPEVVSRTGGQVVIWRVGELDVLEANPRLFYLHPFLKVLTLTDDGRRGFMWEMRPHQDALGEVSPSTLIETIRMAVAR